MHNISFSKLVSLHGTTQQIFFWDENNSTNLGIYRKEASREKKLTGNRETGPVVCISLPIRYLNTWPVFAVSSKSPGSKAAAFRSLNAGVWRMALDDSTPRSDGDTPRWRWRGRFRRNQTWRRFEDLDVLLFNAKLWSIFEKSFERSLF